MMKLCRVCETELGRSIMLYEVVYKKEQETIAVTETYDDACKKMEAHADKVIAELNTVPTYVVREIEGRLH